MIPSWSNWFEEISILISLDKTIFFRQSILYIGSHFLLLSFWWRKEKSLFSFLINFIPEEGYRRDQLKNYVPIKHGGSSTLEKLEKVLIKGWLHRPFWCRNYCKKWTGQLGFKPGWGCLHNINTLEKRHESNYSLSSSKPYCPIDSTLSAAATLGQSWSRSDGNEGVFRIPQSSSITGASTSDCLVS